MAPVKSHLCSLLLVSAQFNSAFLHQSSVISGDVMNQNALITLVSGPLRGHDLLLITDDHIHRVMDVGRVVEAAGASLTPIFLTNQSHLLNGHYPDHNIQGILLTALLLFHHDPSHFLLLLEDNSAWNPSYLILFCLNPHLNTISILSQPVVQRSQFILLLRAVIQANHSRLYAYTSFPMQISAQGHPLIQVPLGTWNPDRFPSRQSLFPSRSKDFGGLELQLSSWCEDEPFLYYDRQRRCIGQNLDALEILGDKYNFTFAVQLYPADFQWGSLVNGTWTGMLGDLLHGGKHIVPSSMLLNYERGRDFDFTYPYRSNGFGFLIRLPPPMSQWKNILYPFSTLMWGLVIAMTLSVGFVLAFLIHHFHQVGDPVGIAFKIAAGLVNQPMGEVEANRWLGKVWWSKVWLAVWWIAVDLLAAAYMSNLVAVLTVPVFPSLIHTVKDLAKSDIIPGMLDYGSFVPEELQMSRESDLATLGEKLYLIPYHKDKPYHLPMALAGNGSYAVLDSHIYLVFLRVKHNLTGVTYMMGEQIYSGYLSWFLPPHTPYTAEIDSSLARLLETGVMAHLFNQHFEKSFKQHDVKRELRGDGVLNLGHLQGAFILLGLGLGAGTLSFLLEHLASPRHRSGTFPSLSSLPSDLPHHQQTDNYQPFR